MLSMRIVASENEASITVAKERNMSGVAKFKWDGDEASLRVLRGSFVNAQTLQDDEQIIEQFFNKWEKCSGQYLSPMQLADLYMSAVRDVFGWSEQVVEDYKRRAGSFWTGLGFDTIHQVGQQKFESSACLLS